MYSRVHRFLLRSIASRGVVTMAQADKFLKSFDEESNHSIPELVRTINDELRNLQQTIKIAKNEMNDEDVLIFLSLGYDEATKAQNLFTALELEYFRLLLEFILTTETREIKGIHAINLVSKMKGSFSKTDALKTLNTWCRMFYLEKCEENYALGVRAIHEFESYFRQNMPDVIEDCCLCKKIVFRGYNCPSCSEAVHSRCLNQYLDNVYNWPCCKSDYDPSQLVRTNCDTLSQTQRLEVTQQEPTVSSQSQIEVTQESIEEEVDLTQTAFGISQCVTRKRKRQAE